MGSSGKKKTTMGKLNRERKLRERRIDKQAKKEARKYAAANPDQFEQDPTSDVDEPDGQIDEQHSVEPVSELLTDAPAR
jgi:hypothetical protein